MHKNRTMCFLNLCAWIGNVMKLEVQNCWLNTKIGRTRRTDFGLASNTHRGRKAIFPLKFCLNTSVYLSGLYTTILNFPTFSLVTLHFNQSHWIAGSQKYHYGRLNFILYCLPAVQLMYICIDLSSGLEAASWFSTSGQVLQHLQQAGSLPQIEWHGYNKKYGVTLMGWGYLHWGLAAQGHFIDHQAHCNCNWWT